MFNVRHWFTQSNSGAGPAGLALASTLVQAPNSANRFRINVYEAASTFVEIGAGILISGRSFAIARALGFEDKFKEIDQQKDKSDAGLCSSISDFSANSLSSLPEFTIFVRRSDLGDQSHEFYRISPGELLFVPSLLKPTDRFGRSGRGAAFHRAQFRSALAEHITSFPQVEIHFNKRVTDIIQSGNNASELHFTDRTKAFADIVIGYVFVVH